MRGMFAGSTETDCARAWSGTEARTSRIVIVAGQNCTGANLLFMQHRSGIRKQEESEGFGALREEGHFRVLFISMPASPPRFIHATLFVFTRHGE